MITLKKSEKSIRNKSISGKCEKMLKVSVRNNDTDSIAFSDQSHINIPINISRTKKAIRDYGSVILGGGSGRFIAMLNAIIIARVLGPSKYGLFSVFFTVMMLIWLFPQAFDTTFIKFAKTGSIAEKKDFLKVAFLSKIAYSILLLFVSYPLSYFLAQYCFQKPEIQMILIASMFCGVFITFCTTVASVFQEKEKFLVFAALSSSYSILVFIVIVLLKLFQFTFTLNKIILVYLVVTGVIGILSFKMLYSKVGRHCTQNSKALKQSLGLGRWIFAVTLTFYFFQRLDLLYLTRSLDFNSIGIYSAAKQLTMVISVMSGLLAGVFLPKASKALLSREAFREYIMDSALAILMMIMGLICFIVIAPLAVKILFGIEYIMTISILRILLIGWLFFVIYQPFSFLFYTLEDARTRFYLEFTKLAMALAMLNWLVPLYGMKGAAIAMSVSIAVTTCLSLIVLKYRLNLYWRKIVC